jgi:hypothetical protein
MRKRQDEEGKKAENCGVLDISMKIVVIRFD